MAPTVTWSGGTIGDWFTALDWSGFSVPTAADDVAIPAGDTVTIDGSTAFAGNVTLAPAPPTAANLDLVSSLTLDGTLSGGALVLSGTLNGGTLENTALSGAGGTLVDVTVAGTMTSVAIGFLAIDPFTAASFGATVTVDSTLTLEAGLYDHLTFAGLAAGLEALQGGSGTVTLGPNATVQGFGALSGDLLNQGAIGGGQAATTLSISGVAFTNTGTLSLTPTATNESKQIPPNIYYWTQETGPTVTIGSTSFDNAGLISLVGGTLTLRGASIVNSGTIALVDGSSQGFLSAGTNSEVHTYPLTTAVTIGAPFSFFDNTGVISADLIDFAGPVALASLGHLSGALQFDNTLDLGGGTLDASIYGSILIDGEVANGTLAAGTGTLILGNATLDNVAIAAGGSVVVQGSLALVGVPAGASEVLLGGTTTELILNGGGNIAGVVISATGTVTDTLELSGGTVTLAPSASLVAGGATLDVTGPGTLENNGAITVSAGVLAVGAAIEGTGAITLAAGTTLADTAALGGSLAVTVGSNAVLDVGTLEGNAVVTVEAGARVTIDALAGAPTIDFAGSPALVVLPGTGALAVTLRGLTAGDLIDFTSVSSNAPPGAPFGTGGAAEANGTLDVTGASGDTARVTVQSQPTYLDFGTTIDGSGGTLVRATACYRTGTRIATARGEVPVERLRRGDLVRTASGHLRPVVWLGRRRVACRRHSRPEEVWPVRVAAHAFAPGRPARDLYLSPDHAVWFDGALIPVRYLLNGATIAQRPVPRVEYWHIELPAHDLLLAESLPVESYLDTGNRAAFEGMGGRRPLAPAAALRIWRQRACAPLLASGSRLAAAHAALLARARTLGHTLTEAPALRLHADGRPVAPSDALRFRLPEGARTVRLLSRSFVPAHLAGPGHDHRRLGIAVGAIRLDGEALPLHDPRLGPGWHAPEAGWRWTTGEAVIAAAGARELTLTLAINGRYWRG
jgi:hypothetical protein